LTQFVQNTKKASITFAEKGESMKQMKSNRNQFDQETAKRKLMNSLESAQHKIDNILKK
jgi:endonuclease V-like protein UPF0215 family